MHDAKVKILFYFTFFIAGVVGVVNYYVLVASREVGSFKV
jgi:hypothetical protein